MPKLGFNFVASASDLSWEQYFREYREQLDAAKRAAAGDVEEDEYIEVDMVVAQTALQIDLAEAPAATVKIAKAAQALGWEVQLTRSIMHHAAVKFKTGQRVGETRTPEFDQRNYVLMARDASHKTGFVATWRGKGLEGRSATFQDIILRDPIGIPDELFFDYGNERRNAQYNDGVSWLAHTKVYRKVEQMTLWLDDWLTVLAPDFPQLTRKKQETPQLVNEWRSDQ